MVEKRLPREVHDLLRSHVASMAHLDVLLLLSRHPAREYSADQVAAETVTHPTVAARVLRDLAGAGLAAVPPHDGLATYRFAPATEALRRAVEMLPNSYARFPVQVVRAVYDRPQPGVEGGGEEVC